MIENITEKFMKEHRWYVKLESSYNGRKVIPYANYIWLKGNPAFEEIPKGYVIHHLDEDQLNDDISNLVIMQKFHHVSYHWKQKTINPKVKIKESFDNIQRTTYFPTVKPRVYRKRSGKYFIQFGEKSFDGKTKQVNLYSWEGCLFRTKEMAEKIANKIWGDNTEKSFG